MAHTVFKSEDDEVNENGKRPVPSSEKQKKKKRVKTFPDEEEEVVDGSPTKEHVKRKKRQEEAERLLKTRELLPVWPTRAVLVDSIREHPTVILLAATGSGKTTQVPQFLLDEDFGSIACTQPRRVAAVTLAARVAAESGTVLGQRVGYTVRFDDKTTEATRLRYMTDGSLLAEMLSDRYLERYSVVIVDEAHERSLRTDMLLGFLKEAQRVRSASDNKLKIIVMSATIDAQRFSDFYGKAPILGIQGRQHQVRLLYAKDPVIDYIEAAVATIASCHVQRSGNGTILVFLPGQDDIETVAASLRMYLPDIRKQHPTKPELEICPLYARLASSEQANVFQPPAKDKRRVVLATNVAETSITIPGVSFVIDTGLAKEKTWDSTTGIDSLQVASISKSSAKQRAGRAGREGPGVCFRLYTEKAYDEMDESTVPEIQRVALPFALLHLLASGANDVFSFPYMDRPNLDHMEAALMELIGLGAINDKQQVTKRGQQMAKLPIEPNYAASLLRSFETGCSKAMLSLVALVSARDSLLVNPSGEARDKANAARAKFNHRRGDHLTLLNILTAFEEISPKEHQKAWCRDNFVQYRGMLQALEARKQLRDRCVALGLDVDADVGTAALNEQEEDALLESLLHGLYSRVALKRPDGKFSHIITREPISVHPSSVLHGRQGVVAFVYDELVLTSKPYARGASTVELSWLARHPYYARHQSQSRT